MELEKSLEICIQSDASSNRVHGAAAWWKSLKSLFTQLMRIKRRCVKLFFPMSVLEIGGGTKQLRASSSCSNFWYRLLILPKYQLNISF
jgi:hypothetical protein